MRLLVWLALGFGLACGIGAYLWPQWWLLGAGALGALGCVVLRRRVPAGAWIGLGLVLGAVWFWCFDSCYTAPLRALDGETVQLELTTVGYSWETNYGTAVDCDLKLDGKRYRLRLYREETMPLEPWTALDVTARLRLTTDGGQSEPTFHRTQGILALAYAREEGSAVPRTDRKAGLLVILQAELRRHILSVLERSIPGEGAAFAKALLLGDKTDLSYARSTDFKVSGISHIIAVSGLHMSIVFALLSVLTGKRRWLLALLGIPGILMFMLAAGFTPSVTRAGIMMILMILSLLLRREYDPPTALAFSVVVMLVINPLVAASVGFQLSVGSVAGIFLFMGRLHRWLSERIPEGKGRISKRLRRWFVDGISTSLSAQVITTPLVAIYFHTVSLIGVLTNLLVLWIVSATFYGVMLVWAVGAIWPAGGVLLGRLVSFPIGYICQTAHILSRLPLAAVYTQSVYVVIWLCFVYGLIALLLTGREARPGRAVALAAGGLVLALGLSWAEPLIHEQSVTVLDVGQGQSVLLQHGRQCFLVDCGGDYDAEAADMAAQTLLSMGIQKLDGLILTHYDRDHTGGVEGLLYRIGAERLYLPLGQEGQTLAETHPESQPVWVTQALQMVEPGLTITLYPSEYAVSDNESSIAVLFQTENCDTLITGDRSTLYEQLLLRAHPLPDLEILIAGHHGSKNATCQALLEQTAPDVVVISCGRDNPYGHPAQQTLERLALAGCTVYRTDQSGTIILRR